MTQLEQKFERQYVPIEPKSNFPNPYRIVLKKLAEYDKEHPISSKILWGSFMILAPGSLVYNRFKVNDIRRELCEERGLDFTPFEFNESDNVFCFVVEAVKTWTGIIALAHYLN